MASKSRYLIGIDLGTTNTVVAFVDSNEVGGGRPPMRIFPIPQLVAEREVESRASLPSFLYFPAEGELASSNAALPWPPRDRAVVGALARDLGALSPGRVVASAKSWLSNPRVDRTAKLLPFGADETSPRVSPVEASSRYLAHIRDAWNAAIAIDDPGNTLRFERQEIVVTVPASFDEEARELTVEAALDAGLENFTLLEEPLAAFYAWIYSYEGSLSDRVHDDELTLVCDVGGGTTDFSLVRAMVVDGEVEFERVAIGEHLLLGGDNVDFALAHLVESKLGDARLTARQRDALRQQCRRAKERLLGDEAVDRERIQILGSGRAVVGGALSAELTADEVVETVVGGFLPAVGLGDLPKRSAGGLRELGLPYVADTAITRHLAEFLTRAGEAVGGERGAPVRPDAILFNGGFFIPEGARDHTVAVVSEWFSPDGEWQPRVLVEDVAESAVAVGAAFYGLVRRGIGRRIGGGSARAYYLGIEDAGDRPRAVCVLARGAEEGEPHLVASQTFRVLTNRPVLFSLYSSRVGRDVAGDVVEIDEERFARHAPLVTVLRYGKRSAAVELGVRIAAALTPRGTIELWCESIETPHRWRLQFQLSAPTAAAGAAPTDEGLVVDEEAIEAAERLVRAVFGDAEPRGAGERVTPDSLMGRLESAIGYGRDSWPAHVNRRLADLLVELAEGRERSARHESRWLNLLGFCLRPGFGAEGDRARVEHAWTVYREGTAFPRDTQSLVEREVFVQRIAGGLGTRRQQEVYEQHRDLLTISERDRRRAPQLVREGWRALASLEQLPSPVRVKIGRALLRQLEANPSDRSLPWAIGRVGARIPFYGPIASVVSPDVAAGWIERLVELPLSHELAFAISLVGARTNDPERDVDDDVRHLAVARLGAAGIRGAAANRLRRYLPSDAADASRIFGESLPNGLRLGDAA